VATGKLLVLVAAKIFTELERVRFPSLRLGQHSLWAKVEAT